MEKEEATLHTRLKSGRVEREGHFQMRGRKRRPRYVAEEDRRGHVIYVGVGGGGEREAMLHRWEREKGDHIM